MNTQKRISIIGLREQELKCYEAFRELHKIKHEKIEKKERKA
jgi:hypothetical protein